MALWQSNGSPKEMTAIKITVIYLTLGTLWILLSDQVLNALIADHEQLVMFETYKGWLFVAVTGVLLYGLVRQRELQLHQAQTDLKERERSMATLIQHLPGIAYRCKNNRLWTMEFISEGCLALTGYSAQEILMNRQVAFVDLIHPDDRETAGAGVQNALNTRSSYELQYRIRTRQGEEKWLWEQGSGVYDPDGKVIALEGFIADITERVKGHERERELHAELERTAIRTATLLCRVIDERDQRTAGHCTRLANLCVELGERLALPADRIHQLRYAALLHDIGKVRIPDAILNKPGRLSPEEWQEMRSHVEVGASLVAKISKLKPASEIILQHHERWDGQGYPAGLQADEIMLEARILAVVDAFDAMTNERPYRGPLSPQEALRELENHAGKQWDPQVVSRFAEMLQRPGHPLGRRPVNGSEGSAKTNHSVTEQVN